jgi:hypothetical protein
MRLVKEIRSKIGTLHFRRWALFETTYVSLYFHQIYRADEDPHLHNHPWNIATWILDGGYIETTEAGDEVRREGSFAYRTRKQFHKIKELLKGRTCTLALCIGKRNDWGYKLEDGSVVSNEQYRKLKHETRN